jgi:hypothetical protein
MKNSATEKDRNAAANAHAVTRAMRDVVTSSARMLEPSLVLRNPKCGPVSMFEPPMKDSRSPQVMAAIAQGPASTSGHPEPAVSWH